MAVDLRRVSVPVKITDVGTAETIVVPVTPHLEGQLVRATHALGGTISGADSKIVITAGSAAAVTITVAHTSSAAGDIDFLDFGNVFVKAGQVITIANGGESTGAATGTLVLDIAK
jgi:hypothetical protein